MPDIYEFSEGFQLKILSLISRDKKAFISYREVLKPSYFKKAIHIDLARIITEFYDKELQRAKVRETPINAPTKEVLWEEVRTLGLHNAGISKIKDQYLDTILDMYETPLEDAEYIKDKLIDFGKTSALEHAILSSVSDLEKHDFSQIEDRISKALLVGQDMEDLGTDYYEDAPNRTKSYGEGTDGVVRIPTGMIGLDKIMHGGLGDGELGVILAPPNRGKSYALINIGAGAVLEGYNVAHYTLEMKERPVSKRYDEKFMKKNFEYLKDNSDKVLTAIRNMQKMNMGQLYVKKYASRSCTVDTIRGHLTRLEVEKNFRPDLIIIDYGDLVQSRKGYSDKRFELESVYLDMRDLAEEYHCPVWTASQANRDSLNKKVITMADLAEAFSKANIADFMASLCQTEEEKEDGIMRWYVTKQREGEASISLDGEIDYDIASMLVYEVKK